MTTCTAQGALKRFGRTAWRFQKTFHTPLQNLELYVSTILSGEPRLEQGCVTVDQIVFDPKHLEALLSSHKLSSELVRESSICASGLEETQRLLIASFSDWVDFWFVPQPKSFAIYADHDEYTTFYASTKSNLARVVSPLLGKGFKEVPDFAR